MKSLLVLVTLASLGGVTLPAMADPAAGPSPTVAPPVKTDATPATADPDKLICKSKAKTGSRFPERTCMTKAQWDDLWAKSRDNTNNAQMRGYRANGGGAGG